MLLPLVILAELSMFTCHLLARNALLQFSCQLPPDIFGMEDIFGNCIFTFVLFLTSKLKYTGQSMVHTSGYIE